MTSRPLCYFLFFLVDDRICHPLQVKYQHQLSEQEWDSAFEASGKIKDPNQIKEHIFFQGCCSSIRHKVYPFLLGMYRWDSTEKERTSMLEAKTFQYEAINKRRVAILDNVNSNNFSPKKVVCFKKSDYDHITVGGNGPCSRLSDYSSTVHEDLVSLPKTTDTTLEDLPQNVSDSSNFCEIEYHSNSEEVEFLKEVQNIVEKDVLGVGGIRFQEAFFPSRLEIRFLFQKPPVFRTDRQFDYFSGVKNRNLDKLRRILLNFSTLTHKTYTQGMSDLASPLLMLFDNEALCFWCFVGLMEKHTYISSPKDEDIRKELVLLRRLIKFLVPKFYRHILGMGPGAQDLLGRPLEVFRVFSRQVKSLKIAVFLENPCSLFAHRWILLLFKREWSNLEDGLFVWESIWTEYQSKHFHLFIACSIIELYGQDPVVQKLDLDESLLHFSQITGNIDAEEVLRRARKLVYNVRISKEIPCYINDIITGFYQTDANYATDVTCIGHLNGKSCTFGLKTKKDKQIESTQNQINHFSENLKNSIYSNSALVGNNLKEKIGSVSGAFTGLNDRLSRFRANSSVASTAEEKSAVEEPIQEQLPPKSEPAPEIEPAQPETKPQAASQPAASSYLTSSIQNVSQNISRLTVSNMSSSIKQKFSFSWRKNKSTTEDDPAEANAASENAENTCSKSTSKIENQNLSAEVTPRNSSSIKREDDDGRNEKQLSDPKNDAILERKLDSLENGLRSKFEEVVSPKNGQGSISSLEKLSGSERDLKNIQTSPTNNCNLQFQK